MSNKILDVIKQKQREQIEKHMPAKNAPVPENLSDFDEFVQAFEDIWVAGADTSRAIEDDGFHPSSLGIKQGKCARRNFYLLKGVAKQSTPNARLQRIFSNGHDVHNRLQSAMYKMGVDFQDEIPIDFNDPPIKGHCDGVLTWKDKKILIEIKSCSEEVFSNRLRWKKPKDEHFDQANIYAYVLDIDTIYVIYENKNTQELKVFECKADKEKAEKVIDEWRTTYSMFKEDIVPKRPYKPESPICAVCDLVQHCRSDPETGVSLKDYLKEKEEKDA